MNTPIINIQEAFALGTALGKVTDVSSIKPPYDDCILIHTPFENCTEFKKISCHNDDYFDVRHMAVFKDFREHKDVFAHYSDARIFYGSSDATGIDYEVLFINGIEDKRMAKEAQLMFQDNLFFTLFSLNLMNCKNIKYINYDPNTNLTRQSRRKRERDGKSPYLVYKTLEIQPLKEKISIRRKPAIESENGQRLHTVRGHFKTYTEEHPLFGKHTGTYWWGDCIKGSMDIGIVEKDYCIYIEPDIFKNLIMKTSR